MHRFADRENFMLKRRFKIRWVWYASRSERPIPLDERRYPSIEFDKKPVPRPEWICQAENGGLHVDARIGRIDVHVASHPVPSFELNWTDPYALHVVSTAWLDPILDLVDGDRVFFGTLFLDGQSIEGWQSVHGLQQPVLKSAGMTVRSCARCGNVSTWTKGKEYFDDPAIADQVLLVEGSGLYLREDIVRERNIRLPIGSFEPSFVVWKPG